MASIRSWIDQHRLLSFVAIAYSFTWTIQGALAYSGMEASWTHSILIGFGGFGPPIGAAVVIWASDGSLRRWIGQMFKWRIGAKWWALAFGLPLIILSLGVLLFVLAGGPIDLTEFESPFIYLFSMVWGTVWGGGQEDLGWRGFMLHILQNSYSALTSSAIVGVTWGAWHLPLFLNATTTHGGWPLSQQLLWMISILAGSVLWTWMYNSTGGSVLAVAVFHAGINAMDNLGPFAGAEHNRISRAELPLSATSVSRSRQNRVGSVRCAGLPVLNGVPFSQSQDCGTTYRRPNQMFAARGRGRPNQMSPFDADFEVNIQVRVSATGK